MFAVLSIAVLYGGANDFVRHLVADCVDHLVDHCRFGAAPESDGYGSKNFLKEVVTIRNVLGAESLIDTDPMTSLERLSNCESQRSHATGLPA
jgi:hypothetical protein